MENQEVLVAGNRTLIKLAAGNQGHAMKEHLSSQLNLDTQKAFKENASCPFRWLYTV